MTDFALRLAPTQPIMNSYQVELVKKTWKIFREIDPVVVGDVFYSKLFLDAPQLKNLFHISVAEQSIKLVDMLSVIVGRLDRLDEITESIRQLAIRHVAYGVKPFHYKLVGNALLYMLEKGLGKDWSPEVREAWAACYKALSDTMIEATR